MAHTAITTDIVIVISNFINLILLSFVLGAATPVRKVQEKNLWNATKLFKPRLPDKQAQVQEGGEQ